MPWVCWPVRLRNSPVARASFERFRLQKWLESDTAIRVAEALIDDDAEKKLDERERGIFENYRKWANRNREYTRARMKKAKLMRLRRGR